MPFISTLTGKFFAGRNPTINSTNSTPILDVLSYSLTDTETFTTPYPNNLDKFVKYNQYLILGGRVLNVGYYLQIIDTTNIDTNGTFGTITEVEISESATSRPQSFTVDIDEQQLYLYANAKSNNSLENEFLRYDITDPLNPTLIHTLTNYGAIADAALKLAGSQYVYDYTRQIKYLGVYNTQRLIAAMDYDQNTNNQNFINIYRLDGDTGVTHVAGPYAVGQYNLLQDIEQDGEWLVFADTDETVLRINLNTFSSARSNTSPETFFGNNAAITFNDAKTHGFIKGDNGLSRGMFALPYLGNGDFDCANLSIWPSGPVPQTIASQYNILTWVNSNNEVLVLDVSDFSNTGWGTPTTVSTTDDSSLISIVDGVLVTASQTTLRAYKANTL